MAALALVPVALALPRFAAFTLAVFRLLGADNWAVVNCTSALGHGDGPLGRRNTDGCCLPASRHLVSSIGEHAEAVRGTPFKCGELGFQCGEPRLKPGFKGFAWSECAGADD